MPCLDAAVPGLVVAVLGFDAKLPTVIEASPTRALSGRYARASSPGLAPGPTPSTPYSTSAMSACVTAAAIAE